jgi:transcriptional regulator with XRE-family HTH domain
MAFTTEQQTALQRLSRGDRLRWIMEYRGIKQTELAVRIGLTQSAISNLVTDKARKPSAPTLLKLADVLGLRPEWLLHGDGNPFPNSRPGEPTPELAQLVRALSESDRQLLTTFARRLVGPVSASS